MIHISRRVSFMNGVNEQESISVANPWVKSTQKPADEVEEDLLENSLTGHPGQCPPDKCSLMLTPTGPWLEQHPATWERRGFWVCGLRDDNQICSQKILLTCRWDAEYMVDYFKRGRWRCYWKLYLSLWIPKVGVSDFITMHARPD